MAEPFGGILVILFGLLLGPAAETPADIAAEMPAQAAVITAPVAVPARSVACGLGVDPAQGLAATIAAGPGAFAGSYELNVQGNGSNTIRIQDRRHLTLGAGEARVVGTTQANVAGNALRAELIVLDQAGRTVCAASF